MNHTESRNCYQVCRKDTHPSIESRDSYLLPGVPEGHASQVSDIFRPCPMASANTPDPFNQDLIKSTRIAIIGGGPGGLTLGRLLQNRHIPFTIYELDESRHTRQQGGTLDIHQNSGQKAINDAGLQEIFSKLARKEGAELYIRDYDGTILLHHGSELAAETRPEIDRHELRDMLLDSLEEGVVKWGKKVVRVIENSNSTLEEPRMSIEFEDGAVEGEFDLVVGADGAWSRVRKLVTDIKPFYSGVSAVTVSISNVDESHPELSKYVGMGSNFQSGDHQGLMSQRLGDGSIMTNAMIKVPADYLDTCGIDWKDGPTAKRLLIEKKYKDWNNSSKELFLQGDSDINARQLFTLPIEMRWNTRPGVTLIGDAAHLMTPFGGVGVNLALIDALDLANAIQNHVEKSVDWKTALQRFEEKMLARSTIEARQTVGNQEAMFGGGGAAGFFEHIKDLLGEVGSVERENM